MSRNFCVIVCFLLTANPAHAGILSRGVDGINSTGLSLFNGGNLTGSGILIGQVEFSRPGKPDFDTDEDKHHDDVEPAAVYVRDGTADDPSISNLVISVHAEQVASVIIGAGGSPAAGVAPGAALHSSAANRTGAGYISFATPQLTAQNIATLNDNGSSQNDSIDDVRAINMSFGLGTFTNDTLNGQSPLTAFIDWSARKHDVLYVVSGNQFNAQGQPDEASVPTDNFNGITVAASARASGELTFRQVSSIVNNFSANVDAVGARTSVDLIAPGFDITVAGFNNTFSDERGTSLAAPHVTGTVALLQEYGDERIANSGNPAQWNPNARRHEVMKAVLMNSADKIKDDENASDYGKYLGMERTVLKTTSTGGVPDDWFDSDAYLGLPFPGLDFTQIPLDEEMGAGHLNAKRALQQFIPGEQEVSGNRFDPVSSYTGDVPVIGWDYGTVSGASFPLNKYLLDGTLEQGDFISITLAWDIKTDLLTDDGEYNAGDAFKDGDLTNLDLYLVPKGTFDIGTNDVGLSDSSVSPVEHMFLEIPETGEYEIWVLRNDTSTASQDYALSWWYGLAPELDPPTPSLDGDFDNDEDVDGADFLAWQRGFGDEYDATDLLGWEENYGNPSTTLPGNFDGDTDVDGFDFLTWQRDPSLGDLSDWESNFGNTGGTLLAAASAVPEPTTGLLLLAGLGFAMSLRPRRLLQRCG